jgi:hypothetical protein
MVAENLSSEESSKEKNLFHENLLLFFGGSLMLLSRLTCTVTKLIFNFTFRQNCVYSH